MLNIIFTDPEAGCASNDEPDDYCEEDVVSEDEISVYDEDIVAAMSIENELIIIESCCQLTNKE